MLFKESFALRHFLTQTFNVMIRSEITVVFKGGKCYKDRCHKEKCHFFWNVESDWVKSFMIKRTLCGPNRKGVLSYYNRNTVHIHL